VLVLVRLRYRSGAREGTGLRPRSRCRVAGWLVIMGEGFAACFLASEPAAARAVLSIPTCAGKQRQLQGPSVSRPSWARPLHMRYLLAHLTPAYAISLTLAHRTRPCEQRDDRKPASLIFCLILAREIILAAPHSTIVKEEGLLPAWQSILSRFPSVRNRSTCSRPLVRKATIMSILRMVLCISLSGSSSAIENIRSKAIPR
jgi:hypothetical protein